MAKINSYDYPELSFSEAVKMLKQFHEKLNGKVSSFTSLAHAFDSSEKSGWFKVKVGDLRKYGLIEGRGDFKISDIGQDILFFNKQTEYQIALKKVLTNIDLFNQIYERAGKEVQDIGTFKAILGDITHAEKGFIQNKAEQIRNIYIDLVSYINEVSSDEKEKQNAEEPKKRKMENLPENMIKGELGGVYIEMPKTEDAIKMAEHILKGLKAEITGKIEDLK